MPFTQADVDALRAQIKTFGGVDRATMSDGQSTDYDLDAALKLLAKMESEVTIATVGTTTRYASTSKGL